MMMLTLFLACGQPTTATTAPSADAVSAAPSAPAAKPAAPSAVDVAALKEALSAGAVVVDVRTDGEFSGGHVPGALHIPLDQLQTRIAELEPYREAPLYLICASGARSARAVSLLAGQGFTQPINVSGGTRAWQEAGYPLD